jgi:hypothetical protein
MGELNRDSIDKQIESDTRVATSQGQEEHPPAGKLGEVYVLLGKGLPLGEIASELRIKERELRWLLKVKANQ